MAAILGFTGVLMAAAGSHWVMGLDESGMAKRWQSANLITLIHAPTLLALTVLLDRSRWVRIASLTLFSGVVVFSGSLYGSLLFHWDQMTQAAPAGGVLLFAGWAALFVASRELRDL